MLQFSAVTITNKSNKYNTSHSKYITEERIEGNAKEENGTSHKTNSGNQKLRISIQHFSSSRLFTLMTVGRGWTLLDVAFTNAL